MSVHDYEKASFNEVEFILNCGQWIQLVYYRYCFIIFLRTWEIKSSLLSWRKTSFSPQSWRRSCPKVKCYSHFRLGSHLELRFSRIKLLIGMINWDLLRMLTNIRTLRLCLRKMSWREMICSNIMDIAEYLLRLLVERKLILGASDDLWWCKRESWGAALPVRILGLRKWCLRKVTSLGACVKIISRNLRAEWCCTNS